MSPSAGAVDEQIRRFGAFDGAARRDRRRAAARAPRCGSRPAPRRPASRSAQATARALPPAPSSSALDPGSRRLRQRGDEARRVGVVGVDRGRRPRTSACSRRRSPARARVASSASASAASLCGIVTFAPRKPAPCSARTVSSKRSGGTGSMLVAPVAEARALRARRCASRASGCARPASRGPRAATASLIARSALRGVLAAELLALALVGGDVLARTRPAVREKLCAPLPHGLTT